MSTTSTNGGESAPSERESEAGGVATDPSMLWDVVVIGGGAAGLSAAIFTARAGLRTLVLDKGRSAIRQCAHLENFLGFPGGVEPETLLALGRDQVRECGADVVHEQVTEVTRTPVGFRLVTASGTSFEARRVIAASVYDKSFVSTLSPALHDADEWTIPVDAHGRTSVPGFYAAGRITGVPHQAIVSAGHGATVGLTVVRDVKDDAQWPGFGEHYRDWVVHEGSWGSEKWHAYYDEAIPASVPEGADLPRDVVQAAVEAFKTEALERCISKEERTRRSERGRALLLAHIDKGVVAIRGDAQ